MTMALKTKRSQKLYETLIGRKIIVESVSGGLRALETLRTTDRLPAKTLRSLTSLPLENTDDFVKAIEQIAETLDQRSVLRKFLENNNISLEDKGKYFELLADESRMGEAAGFLRKKIRSSDAAAPRGGAADAASAVGTGDSVMEKLSERLKKIQDKREEFAKWLDRPYDPEANKIFEALYDRIGFDITSEQQFLEEIYKQVIMSSRNINETQFYELLNKQRKIRKLGNDPKETLKIMSPEEQRTVRRAQDALAEAAERRRLAFKTARSYWDKMLEEIKYAKDLPAQVRVGAMRIIGKFIIDQIFWWINYVLPYKARRVFNLQNTIYDYVKSSPKLKGVLKYLGGAEKELAPVKFQWAAGILLGFSVDYLLGWIQEVLAFLVEKTQDPEIGKDEKIELTRSAAATLAIINKTKDVLSMYVGGQVIPRAIGKMGVDLAAASQGGMSKEQSIEYRMKQRLQMKRKIDLVLSFRGKLASLLINTRDPEERDNIKVLLKQIDDYNKKEKITDEEFNALEKTIKDLENRIKGTAPATPSGTPSAPAPSKPAPPPPSGKDATGRF